ncbi:putative leucine-rich repeat receptor-like serine/threonine-protein kinase At2g24130 [Cryptomeria japonica]|uniref:putative leucine-rich repeat receptor-like serine/threonine-protein kinase At2g24130 n=1 Tax=Cryptomeria japonica TaxID=3369 RepID=UPI0027DAB3CB|nr:putative leucine-rich repeat receptor-like serine/threonine-protein kinase At2g24130 [Cryptomeria japonica]
MLERLYLDQNKLQGPIPSENGPLKHLGLLSLSLNLLTGEIPQSIGNLPQLRRLHLDNNQFVGKIPPALGRCLILKLIDLSHNNLTGNIPSEISGLKNLQFYFNLSWNSLQGSLPDRISKMAVVQGIDLSGNQLSGKIPSGEIPKAGLFTKLTASSFRGNRELCGQWIVSLPACPSATSSAGSTGGPWNFHKLFKYLSSVISFLMVYCFYILFLYKYFFGKGNVEQPSIEFPYPRISYKELSIATNGFGKGNLLGIGGVGSVYKGILDNGTLIAVKALNLEDEAAHKSFNVECQVLGKTRHRNIIKVITSCPNLDFKGLVFDFMSNGSLKGICIVMLASVILGVSVKWIYRHDYI